MLTSAILFASIQSAATWHPLPPGPTPITNALKGYAPYDSGSNAHFGEATMAFHETSWRNLEPKEGEYAFDKWVASAWDQPFSKDKHIVMRVFVDYPSQDPSMPQWLIDEGVKMNAYTDWGGGLSPDYTDPRLQSALLKLIDALGKRFDRDPRVAFVQLGFLGFWGEWHTWPKQEFFAPLDFQQKVVDASRAAFTHKQLMMRTATNYAATLPTMGYFDDMIPSDTDSGDAYDFLAQIRAAGRASNYKVAPLGGEMVPGAALQYLGKDWNVTVKAVQGAHFTWIGPYGPTDEKGDAAYQAHRNQLSQMLGYDFQLEGAKYPNTPRPGQTFDLTLQGSNRGVAPFYYPWRVAFAIFNDQDEEVASFWSSEDIRSWQPGPFSFTTHLTTPRTPGHYWVGLGVEDPWTKKMGIRFSNAITMKRGFAKVADLKVVR